MPCASKARLIARLVSLTSSGSIAAMLPGHRQRDLVEVGGGDDAVDHADLARALGGDPVLAE